MANRHNKQWKRKGTGKDSVQWLLSGNNHYQALLSSGDREFCEKLKQKLRRVCAISLHNLHFHDVRCPIMYADLNKHASR